ncbi:HET domain-containing protein [Fusarium keratoplasticum]|nr:HET domain-containing protein [Fusarium keratoplasticum]
MSSPCPLCQFFIATVASKKTLPANPDHELEFELESLESQLAYSRYFNHVLKSWFDSSVPCPMSESRVLGLDMAVLGDSTKSGMRFARCATLGSPLDGQKSALSLRRLEPGRIDFALTRECETGAIIKLPEGSEFAALSYVWGQTQGNGPSTASRAGFLPPHIPKTIRDAIQATIRLNIQYLWVYQYCINQKDEIELGEQIGIMDIVYQVATVTLVAACGEDASFGLPGSTLESQIISSRWWSRAWTYQEGLFSRRRLYFTETEIFFECNTICTQEGLAYDLHHLNDLVSDHKSDIYRGAFGYNRGSLDEHIKEVTGRQLTHQGDALNVMRGIFRAFPSMRSPIRHFWGIPIDRNNGIRSVWGPLWGGTDPWRPGEAEKPGYFDAVFTDTLLWRLGGPSRRRDGFPSWSWTGWLGPLREFSAWAIEVKGLTMGVKVLLQKNDGTWKRISESVVAEIDAGNVSGAVPYSPILRIETWVVQVTFKYLPDNDFENLQDLLGTSFDKAVYYVVLPMADPDSPPESHRTGYWPLIPTMAVEANDELHRELCEELLDCLLFSTEAQYGLVVRKVGDVSERLGHLNIEPFVMKKDGPSESESALEYYRSEKRFTDYLPMTTKTVMLG